MSEIQQLRTEMKAGFDSILQTLKEASAIITSKPQKLFRTEEIAERCQVSRREVLRWKQAGLKAHPIGKGFRFKWEDVERFMEKVSTNPHE